MMPIMNTGHLNIFRQTPGNTNTQAVPAVQKSHQSATDDRQGLETQRPAQMTRRAEPEHSDMSMFQQKYRPPHTAGLEQAMRHRLDHAPAEPAQNTALWKLNAEPAHKASPVVVKLLGHAEAMPATQLNIYV
ncbi:hypothetical protein SAMN04488118_101377 [Epibacterium ulvae]|uniref:Uncharacterized protein n=1 Tax=Epibacterium ulvae TaxID=1156985 RepID=A0A1G5PP30_9RHOB|nr:hypothetical protein [Epibacterium ulvae]SCZ50890.1 hypothetical protein SAMN04488118_101377 [Epibacterium ulvae]